MSEVQKVCVCKKCGIEKTYLSGKQNGNYYVCEECRDITILG